MIDGPVIVDRDNIMHVRLFGDRDDIYGRIVATAPLGSSVCSHSFPVIQMAFNSFPAGLASREKIIRLIDYDWKSTSVRRRMTTSD
eukprot:scaffold99216_cov36-Cyclotella_meneghiniana.AAC.1